jgi:hypothetical protein
VLLLVAGAGVVAQAGATPYPTLHQNAIGRAVARPGTLFPNDEIYDVGMREAVTWVAQHAAPGAALVSDAPGVVGEYVKRVGRADLEVRSLSMSGLGGPGRETWLLAQDSHACFESQPMVDQVRRRQRPAYVYRVLGTPAVEAYRLPW